MSRTAISFLSALALLTGCAGPIETRIETKANALLPSQKQYRFAEQAEQDNADYLLARTAVIKALADKQFTMVENAGILLHIALADRPADIAITVGEDQAQRPVAAAKEKKPLQSCKDREHRLSISMTDTTSGKLLYSSQAAEYHCKGSVAQSLPFLIDGALKNLGAEPQPVGAETQTRAGIE